MISDNRLSSPQTLRGNGNTYTTNKKQIDTNKRRISTPKIKFRNNTKSVDLIPQKGTFDCNVNLLKELEDPGNYQVNSEIKKLISTHNDIEGITCDYEALKRSKSLDEQLIEELKKKDIEINKTHRYVYSYTSYFKGLGSMIEDFLNKLSKPTSKHLQTSNTIQNTKQSHSSNTHSTLQRKTMPNITRINLTSQNKKAIPVVHNSALENIYSVLGHEVYTKLINVFERYCFYGKTYTNFNMDYSQFKSFMAQNDIYDKIITRTQVEIIFNKVRNNNKSICFEEFIIIIIELSKLVFGWEKNFLKSFSYFVNKYIVNIPSLQKTSEEKNMERWYFYLESDDFIREIRKHLSHLHKTFIKFKVKDLKIGECINITNFLKMSKELSIIPIFLSAKEIICIINFVKYKKKSLIPTSNFDFCSFIEVICVIALQAFDKYMYEEAKHKYMDHIEKLKIFLKFIVEKI